MEITRAGTLPSTKGPADWFTGSVQIDMLFNGFDKDRVQDPSVGRLNDFDVGLGHKPAVGHGNDVEPTYPGPDQQHCQKSKQAVKHRPWQRRGRLLLDRQDPRCKVRRFPVQRHGAGVHGRSAFIHS